MVNFCAIVGCGNRGNRDAAKSFYRLPAVILVQGDATFNLSKRRREKWISRIARVDLKESNYNYTRVCSDHFTSGLSNLRSCAVNKLVVFVFRLIAAVVMGRKLPVPGTAERRGTETDARTASVTLTASCSRFSVYVTLGLCKVYKIQKIPNKTG